MTTIQKETRTLMDIIFGNNPSFVLHLVHNPFQCSCNNSDFIRWFQGTTIQIHNKNTIVCYEDTNVKNIMEIDIETYERICHIKSNMLLIVSSSVGVLAFICFFVTSIIVYKCRWQIRWKIYKLRYKLQHQGNELIQSYSFDHNADMWPEFSVLFSTYVIFAENDDTTMSWVFNCLRRKVEHEWDIGEMYINGRNDVPGFTKIENIVKGLLVSHSAMWIINPAFLKDNNCRLAANFAASHFKMQRNIIILLNNKLDNYPISEHFCTLLRHNAGITKVTYNPKYPDSNRLFWLRLRNFLQQFTGQALNIDEMCIEG